MRGKAEGRERRTEGEVVGWEIGERESKEDTSGESEKKRDERRGCEKKEMRDDVRRERDSRWRKRERRERATEKEHWPSVQITKGFIMLKPRACGIV